MGEKVELLEDHADLQAQIMNAFEIFIHNDIIDNNLAGIKILKSIEASQQS